MVTWSDVDGRLNRRITLEWDNGLNLQVSNMEAFEDTTQFWVLELDGWYGGVDVRKEDTARSLGHGIFPTPNQRTGRVLTLEGVLQLDTESDRTTAERFLSGLLWDGGFGNLTYEIDDAPTLHAMVKLDGPVKTTPYVDDMVSFSVPLLAPDPFLYGEPRETTLELPTAGQGLKWGTGTEAPGLFQAGYLRWGGSKPPARMTNSGNAEAWPVFTVHGDFEDGFAVTMNGRVIEYPGLVTRTTPVTVDTGSGQVTVNGRDVTHMLIRREWEPVPPKTALIPTLTARNRLSEGWATATWSDTYI